MGLSMKEFIVMDDDSEASYSSGDVYSTSSSLAPVTLFCCVCREDVHRESFSAVQRRLGERGEECYCLKHRSGNDEKYVERLTATVARNLDGEDEAREETVAQRRRRERRTSSHFFHRPREEEDEARLVDYREDFQASSRSHRLDHIIKRYAEMAGEAVVSDDDEEEDDDSTASPTAAKRRISRDDDSRSTRRRRIIVDDDDEELVPSEASAASKSRRRRIVVEAEDDDASLLDSEKIKLVTTPMMRKRRKIVDDDEDSV